MADQMSIMIFRKGKYVDTVKSFAKAKTITGIEKTEDIRDAIEFGMEMQGYSFDIASEFAN